MTFLNTNNSKKTAACSEKLKYLSVSFDLPRLHPASRNYKSVEAFHRKLPGGAHNQTHAESTRRIMRKSVFIHMHAHTSTPWDQMRASERANGRSLRAARRLYYCQKWIMPARRDLWLSSRELISAARRSFSPPLIHPAAQQIKVRAAIINSHPNSVIARRFAAIDSVSSGEINRARLAHCSPGKTNATFSDIFAAIALTSFAAQRRRRRRTPRQQLFMPLPGRSGKVKLMSCSSSGGGGVTQLRLSR